MQKLIIPGTLEALEPIGQYVMAAAQAAGLNPKAAYRLRLAVDEIATNIITHGYEEAGQQGQLELQALLDEHSLTLRLKDSGEPYDPRETRPPDRSLVLEQRAPGGWGVWLAVKGVDQFHYERIGEHNCNIFIMRRAG